jgi:membrane protease YdiL (CAAX protease family)
MKADRSSGSILRFFLLAVLLIVPFWVIGAVTGLQVLPGLPLAGLGTLCPAAAAAIIVHRESGRAGVVALLRKSIHLEAKIWLAPALLLMPVVSALSFAVLRLSGVPVPAPQAGLTYALILCVASFVGALGEELGWSGYAIDPMQARWGALGASIVIGSIWALYHYIGLVQAHRAPMWIAEWTLGTLALRVIIVWLYNNSGRSVLVAALFHTTINVTWQLFPVNGSYYDPGVTGLILAVVAAIAVAGWGPRTLARTASPARRPKNTRTSLADRS